MDTVFSSENIYWLVWLGIGVVFIIAELTLPSFVLIFFGAGALIAGVTTFFGASLQAQILVFGLSSLALLVLLRRTMASIFKGEAERSNVVEQDGAVGALVEVVEAISPQRKGRIKYQGTFWAAEADESVQPGEMVRIVSRKTNDHNTFKVSKES